MIKRGVVGDLESVLEQDEKQKPWNKITRPLEMPSMEELKMKPMTMFDRRRLIETLYRKLMSITNRRPMRMFKRGPKANCNYSAIFCNML